MEAPLNPASFPPGYLQEYSGVKVLGTAGAFIVLEITFTILRFVARRINKAPWGWDDYLIFPSLLANLGQCIIAIIMCKFAGVGYHLPHVLLQDPNSLVRLGQCLLALVWIYGFGVALPKLSICACYLRIFVKKSDRVATYVTMAIIVAWFFANVFGATFQCKPVSYLWDKSIPGGHCGVVTLAEWISLPNIITDLILLVLPLPTVWALHASRSRKIGLTVLFLSGAVGLISGLIRLVVFFTQKPQDPGDITWKAASLELWTVIEPGVYHIAACLPVMRPILTRVLGSSFVNHITNATGSLSRGKLRPSASEIGPIPLSDTSSASRQQKKRKCRRLSRGFDPEEGGFESLDGECEVLEVEEPKR